MTPVLVGSTLAWVDACDCNLIVFLITLGTALAIQVGTNLYNDAVDFERGTDTPNRLGPKRVTAQGWMNGAIIKRGALLSFSAAFIGGVYLTWIGGWPILILGVLSLVAGFAYTGGAKPIAYSPSGELFVLIFFGLAAVMGSYYLQTGNVSASSAYIGVAIGLLASAVMLVNNYRDLDTDRQCGKLTLVHYLERRQSRVLFGILLTLPFLLPMVLQQTRAWLVVGALPISLYLILRFVREPLGRDSIPFSLKPYNCSWPMGHFCPLDCYCRPDWR